MTIPWWRIAAGGMAVAYVLALGFALQPLSRADVWVSPDEAATAAFARAYAETGAFTLPQPKNVQAGGLLGPRSMVARQDTLVPGGFLGMPWMSGVAVWLLGDWALAWFAPVFAGVAVLAWGDMWRRIVDWRVGTLAAIFLAVHPAWLLYASRPLMPNVPFVALLIGAAWALVRWPFAWYGGALSGAAFVAALTVRTAEAVWVLPLTIGLLWYFRKAYARSACISGIAAALCASGAFAALQAATYGHPLLNGYTYHEAAASVLPVLLPAAEATAMPVWLRALFPFGIHERSILRHAWHYGWRLQWWWSVMVTVGVAWGAVRWWQGWRQRWHVPMTAALIAVAGWLAVVYGSWTFHDNPDPRVVTLGNSYARYFLPAFLLATPFAAHALTAWWKSRAGKVCVPILMLGLITASGALVLRGPDGWQAMRAVLPSALEKREVIIKQTPAESIIIMDRSDKYLVGYRQNILVPLRDEQTYAALGTLAKLAPLYYFGLTLPPEDIDHLQQTILYPQGLTLETVQTVHDETLYRVQ